MGNLKRFLATFLIVAMLFTTNGMSVFAVSIVKTLNAESNDLVAESKGVGYYYEHYSAIYKTSSYLFNDSDSEDLESQSQDSIDLDELDEQNQSNDSSDLDNFDESSISPDENLDENENIDKPDEQDDDESDGAFDNYEEEPEEDEV